MQRTRVYEPPMFYHTQDLVSPSQDNFYLRLEKALAGKWGKLAKPLRAAFVKDWGRPTDPIVYLKIMLIAYFENIVFDTDLAERISDSITLRQFLGYTLLEATPDHSSISRVRGQIGEHCDIQEVLETVVAACAEAGLVSGEVAAVDASLLPANAALSSLRCVSTGKPVREHLKELWARNREREKGERKETLTLSNKDFASATDPEARVAHKPGQRRRLCYQATHLTDGQNQIIVAAKAGLADVGEAEAAKEVVSQGQATLQENDLELQTLLADAGYGDADFHAHVEAEGATPLTHLQREGTQKPTGFHKADFTYCPDEQCYRCPMGKLLPLRKRHGERREYRAEASDCQACPHCAACVGDTKSQSRSLWRTKNEDSRDRNKARIATEEGRALLRQRGRIVEAPFGHLKTYGGLGRANCRGLKKVNVKVVLAAVAWDLIKLVKALFPPAPAGGGRGRREAGSRPGVSAEAARSSSCSSQGRSCPSWPPTRTPWWRRAAAAALSCLPSPLLAGPRVQPLLR